MSLASVFLVDRMKGSLCGLAGAVQGEEVPNVRSRRPPGACAALNNEQVEALQDPGGQDRVA